MQGDCKMKFQPSFLQQILRLSAAIRKWIWFCSFSSLQCRKVLKNRFPVETAFHFLQIYGVLTTVWLKSVTKGTLKIVTILCNTPSHLTSYPHSSHCVKCLQMLLREVKWDLDSAWRTVSCQRLRDMGLNNVAAELWSKCKKPRSYLKRSVVVCSSEHYQDC